MHHEMNANVSVLAYKVLPKIYYMDSSGGCLHGVINELDALFLEIELTLSTLRRRL